MCIKQSTFSFICLSSFFKIDLVVMSKFDLCIETPGDRVTNYICPVDCPVTRHCYPTGTAVPDEIESWPSNRE